MKKLLPEDEEEERRDVDSGVEESPRGDLDQSLDGKLNWMSCDVSESCPPLHSLQL